MKLLILAAGLLVAIHVTAQTDSSFPSGISHTYSGIKTLTRSEIERLPVYNFLELVQGAFPFVANESSIEGDYSFVMNGFLLINPNAVNISQIETINFFPAGTSLTRGSLSKKGTFVITTTPGNNSLRFSTKSGLMPDNNIFGPGADIRRSKNGFYSFNELNYAHKAKRWYVSNAFSFFKNQFPQYTTASSAAMIRSKSEQKNFRLSNFAGYQLNQQWKIEAGLLLATKPEASKGDIDWAPMPTPGHTSYQSDQTVDFGQAHAALIFSPDKKITNRFNAELTSFKEEEITKQIGSRLGGSTAFDQTKFNERNTIYSFSNEFLWHPNSNGNVRLDFSFFTRYGVAKSRQKMFSESSYSGQVMGYTGNLNSKNFMVSPAVNISIKEILFTQVGATYDTYGTSSYGKSKRRALLPALGAKLLMNSLLKKSPFSTFEFAGNFNQYLTAFEKYDPFEDTYRAASPIILSPYSGGIQYAPFNAYTSRNNWLGSLSLGIDNDRFLLSLQYRKHEKSNLAYTQIFYGSGYTYTYNMQSLVAKGWAFDLESSIIEEEKKSWKLYTMIFKDDYSIKYPSTLTLTGSPLVDAGKSPLRGGLKTSANVHRLFLQASALFSFNELSYDKDGNIDYDADRFNNNFLLVGYAVPLKSRGIKKFEINAQTRSLFYSKNYPTARYIGIGAQVEF